MLKKYIVVIAVGLVLIAGWGALDYISILKAQNDFLVLSVGQIQKRINSLESDTTLQQIADLRHDNLQLRQEMSLLQEQLREASHKCPEVSPPQPMAQKPSARPRRRAPAPARPSAPGNKGYLLKKS
jgi:uncharacterized coiled-coil protein SlyX